MKKIKIAISQRIIPHYRIPVFRELACRESVDLTVFYGKGFANGSQVNEKNITGFKSKRLFTIFLNYKGNYGSKQLRVWHPGLFFSLIRGMFDVVIVEPSTNIYNNIFVFAYCKLFKKKFIWYDAGSVPKEQRSRLRRIIDPLISFFILRADAFITYNSYADKSLLRDFNIPPEMIFRAQNTIDISNIQREIEKFTPLISETKDKLSITGYKVSLYIGGIETRKKILNLIHATKMLNQDGIPAKTMIVGDGPDKEDLIGQMTPIELEQTIFVGKHITDATLYILISDVDVLPSAGGLSVVQAMACGKPFIGSEEIEHGGIKDYVTHGVNGYLVREDDVEDLYRALKNMYMNDELYADFCNNALEKSKEFTVQNMVNGIQNAINYSMKED